MVAPAQRPAERGAVALEQILGGEASGETGGAPDDNVELAFLSAHHAHRYGHAEAVPLEALWRHSIVGA